MKQYQAPHMVKVTVDSREVFARYACIKVVDYYDLNNDGVCLPYGGQNPVLRYGNEDASCYLDVV